MIRKDVFVPLSNENNGEAMNCMRLTIAGIVLFISAPGLYAQRNVQWSGGAPGNSQATESSHAATAFEARDEQSEKLRSWTQRTTILNRQLEDIRHILKSSRSGDFSSEIETFQNALVADNLERQEFLSGLSGAQHLVLEKPIRALDRTNGAMAEAFAQITEGSGHVQNAKLLSKGLQRAEKAIASEQQEQQRLSRGMGMTA